MKLPGFQTTATRAPGIGLLVVAVVVCGIAVALLTWPGAREFVEKNLGRRASYENAPLAASTIPGNPQIIPTPKGERPRGFPASFPLYEVGEIIQSYRAERPGETGFHTTIVYTTMKPPSDVLTYYATWFTEAGVATELQPVEEPRTLVVTDASSLTTITTLEQQTSTLITVSYAEK